MASRSQSGGSLLPNEPVNWTSTTASNFAVAPTIGATATTAGSTLVGTTDSQTLTNKTLTSPVLNTPVVKDAVTASGGTTRVLTSASSGSINLFDSATAGILYTLPVPAVGLVYTFVSTVLQTGGALKVITDAGTTLLTGAVQMFSGEKVTPSATLGPFQFNSPAASSFISFNMNGTTTGGGIGTNVTFLCTSATTWLVTGTVVSPSGNLATPFANS